MTFTDRATLLKRVKGQQVKVPDVMTTIFGDWPVGVNDNYDWLLSVVRSRLAEIGVEDPKHFKKLVAADFALFASAWWPDVDADHLRTFCFLAIWLFLWDDEIDEAVGSMMDDMEAADAYREDTIDFIEVSLGLSNACIDRPMHIYITSFKPIADALVARYNRDQLERFMGEMRFFMQGSFEEQKTRLDGSIPSVSDYWKVRMATSAVGVTSAAIELGLGAQVPRDMMLDPDMRILWDETNVIVFVTNDILSVKKELAHGNLDSLIPIRCAQNINAQASVDAALEDLRTSFDKFEAAAERLELKYADHKGVEAMRKFIHASRQNCTGNLFWSSVTGRYGLGDAQKTEKGSLLFVL